MRKTISILLTAIFVLVLLPLGTMQPAEAATDYSNIRVLLTMGSPSQFSMAASGTYFLSENGASFTGGTLTFKYTGGKVQVTHSSLGTIYTGSSVNVMRAKIAPSAGYMRFTVNGATRNYLGHFKVSASSSGLRVVNTVPLAHYLYGVVRGEMSNNFPIEALKAQAVAAKCYVLSGMSSSGDYDIGDTASDQVYKGYVSSETTVHAAVDATYDVGLYLGSSILRAYYAASNGGVTQLPSEVWTGTNRYIWDKAYRAGVTDPYDVANPESVQEAVLLPFKGDSSSRMTSSLSAFLKALAKLALREQGSMSSSDSVTSIESVDNFKYYYDTTFNLTSSSSRKNNCEITMTVIVNKSTRVKVTYAFDIMYFNYNGVWTHAQSRSMRIATVTQQSEGFYVYHGRYGHGVGLSQRGAQQMANQGMSYQDILKFYYPGATIKSMGVSAPQDPVNSGTGGSGGTTTVDTSTPIATAVTTGNVTLRQGASTSTTKLDTVPKGTNLYLYAQSGSFWLTQYNNKTGYVHDDYVNVSAINTNTGSDDATTIGSGATGKVLTRTAMRSKASSSGSIVVYMQEGLAVDLMSESGNYYYVHAQGYMGYALKSDIALTSAGTSSGSTGTAGATTVTGSGQTTGKVNFRTGPSLSSSIITMLSKGTKFDIYNKSGEWYYVSVNGQAGYINASYVKETGSTSGTTADTGSTSTGNTITAYGETTTSVNFRTKASTGSDSTVIKKLSKGTAVSIYGKTGSFYHVNVDGKDGYLYASYVKQTETASAGTSAGGTTSTAATWSGVVVKGEVNFRSSPSTSDSSNIISQLPIGTAMTVYSHTNGFYKVTIGTQTGYVSMDYVNITGVNTTGTATTTGTTTSGTGQTGVTTASVRLRSSATTSTSSNIITTLSKGVAVTILGENGHGWYEVTVDGKTGYVASMYVKLT